jgi:hypothetical protein
MRIRTILAAAAVPAALAAALLGTAGAASAAVQQQASYKATAHEANVADTTNVAGNRTINNDGSLFGPIGPVWAYVNLERKLTATDNGNGTWAVQVASQGSFSAFANPIDGNAWTGTGSVNGYVNYTVTSDHAPNGANLPAQLPSSLHSADIVAQWFGVDPSAVTGATVGGVNYHFDYNPIPVPAQPANPSGYLGISYGQGPNSLHYVQNG